MAQWEYKVVAVPRDLAITKRLFSVPDPAETVADYIEQILNQKAGEGWEFYRAVVVSVRVPPGCLGSLLGQREGTAVYNL